MVMTSKVEGVASRNSKVDLRWIAKRSHDIPRILPLLEQIIFRARRGIYRVLNRYKVMLYRRVHGG